MAKSKEVLRLEAAVAQLNMELAAQKKQTSVLYGELINSAGVVQRGGKRLEDVLEWLEVLKSKWYIKWFFSGTVDKIIEIVNEVSAAFAVLIQTLRDKFTTQPDPNEVVEPSDEA